MTQDVDSNERPCHCLTRPLKKDATERQLLHAIHWKRGGKLLDLGCGGSWLWGSAIRGDWSSAARTLLLQRVIACRNRQFSSDLLQTLGCTEEPLDLVTQSGYIGTNGIQRLALRWGRLSRAQCS